MKELINLEEQIFNDEIRKAVSARELWYKLESKQEFTNWIKNRIEKFSFMDGTDYTRFDKVIKGDEKGYGNKTTIEYFITLDMAKELCMLENNAKGKLFRKYFIEIEKQARKPKIDFSDPITGASLYIEAEKKRRELLEKLETIEPIYNKFMNAKNGLTMKQVAGQLEKCGQNKLFRFLRDKGILISKENSANWNLPKQEYIYKGYFKIRTVTIERSVEDENKPQTLVMPKGMEFIRKLWEEKLIKEQSA